MINSVNSINATIASSQKNKRTRDTFEHKDTQKNIPTPLEKKDFLTPQIENVMKKRKFEQLESNSDSSIMTYSNNKLKKGRKPNSRRRGINRKLMNDSDQLQKLVFSINCFQIDEKVNKAFILKANKQNFLELLVNTVKKVNSELDQNFAHRKIFSNEKKLTDDEQQNMVIYLFKCSFFSKDAKTTTSQFIDDAIKNYASIPYILNNIIYGLDTWIKEEIWEYYSSLEVNPKNKDLDPLMSHLAWIKDQSQIFMGLKENCESLITDCNQLIFLREKELEWEGYDTSERCEAWIELLKLYFVLEGYNHLDEGSEFEAFINDIQKTSFWKKLMNEKNSLLAESIKLFPNKQQIFFSLDFYSFFEITDNVLQMLMNLNITELSNLPDNLIDEDEDEEQRKDEEISSLIFKVKSWNENISTYFDEDEDTLQSETLASLFIRWARETDEDWVNSERCSNIKSVIVDFLHKQRLLSFHELTDDEKQSIKEASKD